MILSDHVRLIESGVFGLNVENAIAELDVVVEPHLRAAKAGPPHFRFQPRQLALAEMRDGLVQIGVIAADAFHSLERHLCDTRAGIDA